MGDAERYGECVECGYIATDFESARRHVRDSHNGLGLPRGFDSFWNRSVNARTDRLEGSA